MARYDFLVETYRTERLKTVGVWSQIPSARLEWRPEPRARSPLEHMVHQCMSEDAWMRNMLGIAIDRPTLPSVEDRQSFLEHYATCSAEWLAVLGSQSDGWFEADTQFFDVRRTRAWVLTRRIAHTAHHRGQLTMYIRTWGLPLYSTYGPTADTGGLPKHGARVIYRNASVHAAVLEPGDAADLPPLPGSGEQPVTERPRGEKAQGP
jgi:uncharacterized damage-inducible protein DinB